MTCNARIDSVWTAPRARSLRGWSATLAEWLCAAEYVALAGTRDIVLCERGIRVAVGHEYTRSMLDLQVFGPVASLTPFPVIADPSHATGDAALVPAMSRAAIAAGAHGLLIEVVLDEAGRAAAKSDARQGVTPDVLAGIVADTTAARCSGARGRWLPGG